VELAGDGCWDCPVSFGEVLVGYAVLAVLIAVAAASMAARRQLYRGLGWMATVALFFWALMYTIVIPRWGIGASGVPLEIWSRRASWLILGAMDLALVLVAVTIFRWRSSRRLA
jgi:hypothetical protein